MTDWLCPQGEFVFWRHGLTSKHSGQGMQLISGLFLGKKSHNSPSILSIHSKTHLWSQQFLQDSTFGRTAWSRTTWGHPKTSMQEQHKQSDVSGRRRSLKKIYKYMNPSSNNDLIYYDCKGFMSWTLQANPTSNFSEMFGWFQPHQGGWPSKRSTRYEIVASNRLQDVTCNRSIPMQIRIRYSKS